MAVTAIPNVTNWTVTPQNGQSGYFTLMNTWLGQSTSVIASLQAAISAQNTANTEINALAIQTENNAIVATSLANYQGVWSGATTYAKGQSVSVGGLYYISKEDSNLNHAVTDTNYWLPNPLNNKADKNQTFYIGTTAVTIDRVNGAITLNGTSIDGNAGTATLLQNSRTINGVSFDGSANISVGLDVQGGAYTTSFTLNNTHKNKVLICSGTFNITLPVVGTIKSGDLFVIDNAGTGTLTLVANGNSTDLSRLTILPNEVLILQSDGTSLYRFISRSKDFASNMSASAGYTYLPNGLLMQWGYAFPTIAPNGGVLNITFPTAFPTGVFFSDVAVVDASVNNQLTIPFVSATTLSNLAITNNDVDSIITQIRWFSIGY